MNDSGNTSAHRPWRAIGEMWADDACAPFDILTEVGLFTREQRAIRDRRWLLQRVRALEHERQALIDEVNILRHVSRGAQRPRSHADD